jgi:hypothetical protein
MRLFSALLLILSLAFVSSALAAQKGGAKAPTQAPASAQPAEQIYLESEVFFDEVNQFARDKDGISISGTIQSFYPNGRLAWETQWVNGRLHGITKGYDENRKLKEETTWVNGKLNGPARWYDEEGNVRRETMYEDDKDLSAPDESQEQDASAGQGEAKELPAERSEAPEASPKAEDGRDKDTEKN